MNSGTDIGQKRIFEIAKELNISHIEIVKFLRKEDIACKSIMTAVDEEVYLKILEEFSKEKDSIERIRKERARREAEKKRKAQEETRKLAEDERKKIEEEVFTNAIVIISDAIDSVSQYGDDVRKQLLEEVMGAKGEFDIYPQYEIPEEKPAEKVEEETKRKKKKKEKKKLRRITYSEIESKLGQRTSRKTEEEFARRKGKKRGKEEMDIEEREVEEAVRRTMAKMEEKSGKRKYKKEAQKLEKEEEVKKIKVSEYSTVDTLASLMGVDPSDVIQKCVELGMFVTINQRLDFDTITIIADEFGFEVEQQDQFGEELLKYEDTEEDLKKAIPRPPVVTVMGHVDHGKTSLLDYIRNANVVMDELGGITQHIGAYEVKLNSDKAITFLDTPGHEAFTAMRARGAQVTDIVVIVVAADDGVMPQTVEAINHAKAANVPTIIAINKIDKPNANPETVKRSLADNGVLIEEWGGKVQSAEVSAKTGQGIDHLLHLILLEADMLELKANPNTTPKGIIIEAKLDKLYGPVATVLIQKGTLKIGDPFVCGSAFGRVRAMYNERGQKVTSAGPSTPVVVLGFDVVPNLADVFVVVEDEKVARKIASERQRISREQQQRKAKEWGLDDISAQIAAGRVEQLNVILKCDVDGSVEAISETLQRLGNEEVSVSIKHKAVGQISETDVLLAKASKAIIIGFNISSVNPKVRELAAKENVEIRYYNVIYELIDDINMALEGMLSPEKIEEHLGIAEVREVFKIPRMGHIAGSYISEGKTTRNAKVRVVRENETIFEGEISSLKRFKDDVREVQEGYECGIGIYNFDDFQVGDKLEFYEEKSVKRTLT